MDLSFKKPFAISLATQKPATWGSHNLYKSMVHGLLSLSADIIRRTTAEALRLTRAPKARAIITLAGLNYATAFLGFATSFVLAKSIPVEEFGALTGCMLVAQITATVAGFGGERTLLHHIAQSKNASLVFAAHILKTAAVATAFAPLALAYICFHAQTLDQKLALGFFMLSGVFFALSPRAFLDLHMRMLTHTRIMLLEKFAFAAPTLTLALTLPGCVSLTLIATLFLASRLASVAAQYAYAGIKLRTTFGKVAAIALRLLKNNLLVCISSMGNLALTHISPLLVETLHSPEELAVYGIAFQMVALAQLLQNQFLRIHAPEIAFATDRSANRGPLQPHLRKITARMALFSVLTVTPAIVLGHLLIVAILPENYFAATKPLMILGIWSLLVGPGMILNQFLMGLRLEHHVLTATAISATLVITFSFLLIPRLGALGCAISILLAHPFSISFQAMKLKRHLRYFTPA